jgi:hypothetical protein
VAKALHATLAQACQLQDPNTLLPEIVQHLSTEVAKGPNQA